jgi:hypothetical protein
MYRDIGHYRNENAINKKGYPNSIFCLDTQLIRKILKIMEIGCCRCGWHEGTCDFHHINGRKIHNANTEYNISLICPNCHRLVHEDKVKKEDLIPLAKLIGKRWKNLIHVHWEDDKVFYILKNEPQE